MASESEAQLLLDVWQVVREHLPAGKSHDAAVEIVRAFAHYGYEASDLAGAGEEEEDLGEALAEVFEPGDDDPDEE